jgi:hypothetical protein
MITAKQIDDESVWNSDTLEWEPPLCQAKHPLTWLFCSRAKGHKGPHVALANYDSMLAQWEDPE